MALDSILPTPVTPQPPKAAVHSSSSGPSGSANNSAGSTSGASASPTTGSNGDGSGASRNAAKTPAKSGSGSSSRGASSTRGATSNTQGKNTAASSQAKQSGSSSAQTQSTAGSAAGTASAAQSNRSNGPSFLEALAQSQAEATDTEGAAATTAPQGVTGSTKSSKGAKSDTTDNSPSSLSFLSQSLAAVVAGAQPAPNPGQADTAGAATDGDGVSLAAGSSIQNVVANLTKGVADELQVAKATDSASKGATSATSTAATDGGASGTSAFQAQLSIGSHFQATANAQTVSDKVSASVGTPAFNDELGGKITWMANQGVQTASLQLSPEHLGPLAVHISVQDGSATVAFNANHADTRAALEQALPRLREMFATQGLTLSDASVSQQSPRGQSQKQAVAAIGSIGGVSGNEPTSSIAAVVSARLGLVDTYA